MRGRNLPLAVADHHRVFLRILAGVLRRLRRARLLSGLLRPARAGRVLFVVDAFFFWLGYSNSSVNPILYTIFNEEFRRAFMRILGFKSAGSRER